MNTNYIKNFNHSEFSLLFERFLQAAKTNTPIWHGTVFIGPKPLYLESNIQWISDKIEQYFVHTIPNAHIDNIKELYVLENISADFIPKPDSQNSYVCFLGDDIYKKPDLFINKHCIFIKNGHQCIIYMYKNDFNSLYLGENHLLNKLFNYIFDEPDFTVLHGAVVGYNNRGVLITGLSGYGKSTLAAFCLARNMQFVADDRVALLKKPSGLYAYPIYTTISLGDNIPKEIKINQTYRTNSNTKDILILNKSQISENIQVTAVIEPCRDKTLPKKIIPCNHTGVITRICKDFSLLNTLTPSKNPIKDWNKIFNLLYGLDFFNINLSDSISDNANAIVNFLQTEKQNV